MALAKRPWSKVIEKNKASWQAILLVLPAKARKVGQPTENETAIEWRKKIVLMTGQDVAGVDSSDGLGKSLAAVGQRHSQNGKIDAPGGEFRRCAGNAAGVDVNALTGGFDDEGERFAHDPVRWFNGRVHRPVWSIGIGNGTKQSVVMRRQHMNSPRADRAGRARPDGVTFLWRNAERLHEANSGRSRHQMRAGATHDRRDVEQMIEMGMGGKDGIRMRPQMAQTFFHAGWLGGDGAVSCDRPETGAGEVWIDQEHMAARFELVTVDSEVSDPNSLRGWRRCRIRIGYDQVRKLLEAGVRGGGAEEKQSQKG